MEVENLNKEHLETLFDYYNSRKWVHPDPLEFLYNYSDYKDREIVALVASSLAYGRVQQILQSVSKVLGSMGTSPFDFLTASSFDSLSDTFKDFKHRFTTGDELVRMLMGIKGIIGEYGSLHECFLAGYNGKDETVLTALSFFVDQFKKNKNCSQSSLMPLPENGSACKRLNLFLRWMVRNDNVDPGGWHEVSPSKLIIPLDTHMHRICSLLKLTVRKQADMKTAVEITSRFRLIAPDDPVRYDFAITRLGIRKDGDLNGFLRFFP